MFLELDTPVWLIHLMTVLIGLVVGSFVNVLVARVPKRKSVVRPGSHCPQCKKPIRWYDNIPVASFLLLRGRCRSCKKPISPRYVVIELLTAVLFLAMCVTFGLSPALFLRDWPFAALLVAITFIDLEHRIIPDRLSLTGIAFGILTSWLVPGFGFVPAIAGAALGFGIFYGFAWIYQAITGRAGMGGGDIKLLAMLGAFVGPTGVFTTILVSSLVGSVVGIAWALLARKKNVLLTSIPYGPFLVIGGLYYYLLGHLILF